MKTITKSSSQEDLLYYNDVANGLSRRHTSSDLRTLNRKITCLLWLVSILLILSVLFIGTVAACVIIAYSQATTAIANVNQATDMVKEAGTSLDRIFPIVEKFSDVDLNDWNANINSILDIQRAMKGYDLQISIITNYLHQFADYFQQIKDHLGF